MNKKINLLIMAVFGGGGPFWDDECGTTLDSTFHSRPNFKH